MFPDYPEEKNLASKTDNVMVYTHAVGFKFTMDGREFELKPFTFTINRLKVVDYLTRHPYVDKTYKVDVSSQVVIAGSGRHDAINFGRVIECYGKRHPELDAHTVFKMFQEMLLHELAECLFCDGKHIVDPHPEAKT